MISVTLYTNTGRETKIVPASQTLKAFLDDCKVNYATAQIQLDGAALNVGEINNTFESFGITDSCALASIVKTTNAR